MIRACLLASPALLALAAVASADDYKVETRPVGSLFRKPPTTRTGKLDFTKITRLVRAKDDKRKIPVATTLPFDFQFFGRIYRSGQAVSVSEDGWLAFGALDGNAAPNPSLPSADPQSALMAPLWDDLQTGTRGMVVSFLDGGNLVFAWLRVDTASSATQDDVSFEAVLHPTSGVVDFAYAKTAGPAWSGLSYTVGIESEKVGARRVFPKPDESGAVPNDGFGRPATDLSFLPMTVTLHGSFTRDRPSVSATDGLGSTTAPGLPTLSVALADVEVLDPAGVVVATARTDAAGEFTATSVGFDGAFEVNLLAAGAESRVKKTDGSTWRLAKVQALTGLKHAAASAEDPQHPPTVEVPAVHLDASFDATDFRKALNVQQAARRGFDWAGAAIDASTLDSKTDRKAFKRLEILLDVGAAASGYNVPSAGAAPVATISASPSNDDSYDDYVVLREYAQHLLASMETFPGNLASHLWDPADLPQVPPPARESEPGAFLDGFSFWFATSVMASPWSANDAAFVGTSKFIDTRAPNASAVPPIPAAVVFDLDVPDAVGADVAGAVAASLWDLVDSADAGAAAFDQVAGALPADGWSVLAKLDQRKTTNGAVALPASAPTWTSSSFFAAWIATTTQKTQTAREFIRHKTLADDAYEPNDAPDAAVPAFAPTVASGQKMAGLVLNSSNEDRFKFTFDAARPQVAVTWAESTRIELSILDASGAPVAGPVVGVGPRPGASASAGSASIDLAGTQGTSYVARIVSVDGPAAHYSLAVSTPVSLVSPDADEDGVRRLPDATVDQSYAATVQVAGGFTADGATVRVTYRFDAATAGFDAAVPGLSIVARQSGFDLTGKPTAAKTYELRVLATDESGAIDRFVGTLELRVNASPSIASVFAVAADTDASFDVGTGGTDATWTLTSPTQDSGFTMSGGPTLHVAGRSASAVSFTVKGFMTGEKFDANLGDDQTSVAARVVVCPFLADFDAKLAKPQKPFGFAFDAVAGSDFVLDVAFDGRGTPPKLFGVLDALGKRQGPPGVGSGRARPRVHVGGFKLKTTGTYFVVFEPSKGADDQVEDFTGTVRVAAAPARPPSRFGAVADVVDGSSGLLTFSAIPGSRVVVTLRRGRAPTAALPGGVVIVRTSDGSTFFESSAGDGPTKVFDALPAIDSKSPYEITFTAAAGESGPLLCEVRVTPPAGDTLKTHFLR